MKIKKHPAFQRPILLSGISIYFEKQSILEKGHLPDFSRRECFHRNTILQDIFSDGFTLSEIQEFLSYTLELIMIPVKGKIDHDRVLKFLTSFNDDLTDFSVNRAIIKALCKNVFEGKSEVEELLAHSRKKSWNVHPKKAEAVELLTMHLHDQLVEKAGIDADSAREILDSFRCLSFVFKVNEESFKPMLEGIADYHEKDFRSPVAKAIRKFIKLYFIKYPDHKK